MTKQDEKNADQAETKTTNQKVADKANEMETSAPSGVNPVDDVVFGNRPNQEQLTRAIRQEMYKEVQSILVKYDVELDEEDKNRLLGNE